MPALAIAVLAFVAACASGMAGLALARVLPDPQRGESSRAMLAGVAALAGLLLALTLGVSMVSAYDVTQVEKAAIRRLAADAVMFNLAAKRLGAPAAEARRLIGGELAMTGADIRGARSGAPAAVAADIAAMHAALDALKPEDEAGRRALAEAERLYGEIGAARLMLALPPADPASWPLAFAAMAWTCLSFCALGALSQVNPTTLAALALGGVAAASAIWLTLALGQPPAGPLRPSPAAIDQIMVEIAQ